MLSESPTHKDAMTILSEENASNLLRIIKVIFSLLDPLQTHPICDEGFMDGLVVFEYVRSKGYCLFDGCETVEETDQRRVALATVIGWFELLGLRNDNPSLTWILRVIEGSRAEAMDEFFSSLLNNEIALESFCNGWKDGNVPVPVIYKLLRTAAVSLSPSSEMVKKLLSDIFEHGIGDWRFPQER